ncbi:hypothetical protein CC79DRAFT_1365462 [Sarocladium strictum]
MFFIIPRSAATKALRSCVRVSRVKSFTYPRTQSRAISQTPFCLAKRFTKSHEWLDIASDGKSCTVGISQYAADALGDVVYVELPEAGAEVIAEEPLGTVESVKSASDVNSPVSGTVTSVNEALADTPSELSKDPENASWLVKLETTDAAAAESLMDEAEYAEYVKGL